MNDLIFKIDMNIPVLVDYYSTIDEHFYIFPVNMCL